MSSTTYSALTLTAHRCDDVLNVQATGLEAERASQNENCKLIMLQRFSNGCTDLLKTDMGERLIMSGVTGKGVATPPPPPVLLTD
jgi:hypothetical protein